MPRLRTGQHCCLLALGGRSPGELQGGPADTLIPRTATDVARERRDQCVRAWFLRSTGQSSQGHHNAGRAEAALQSVFVTQCLLNRVQGTVGRRESFDRGNARAVGLYGQHQTRPHGLTVNNHRAGAADTMFAAEMDTCVARLETEKVTEQQATFDSRGVLVAVDGDLDVVLAHADFLTPSLSVNVRANSLRPTVRRYSAEAW